MKMYQIWQKARALKIDVKKLGKTVLIRRIQMAEGYSPCFATGVKGCPEVTCCWREDCKAAG